MIWQVDPAAAARQRARRAAGCIVESTCEPAGGSTGPPPSGRVVWVGLRSSGLVRSIQWGARTQGTPLMISMSQVRCPTSVWCRAQSRHVLHVGRAAGGPGDDVVHLAVLPGHGAPGDDAADVAGDQGVLLRRGRQPDGAADREDGAVTCVQHPLQPGPGEQVREGLVGWAAGVLDPRPPRHLFHGFAQRGWCRRRSAAARWRGH